MRYIKVKNFACGIRDSFPPTPGTVGYWGYTPPPPCNFIINSRIPIYYYIL